MGIKDRALARAVGALLDWKSRPDSIRRALRGRRYAKPASPADDRLVLGVVQMQIDLVEDGVQFADRYYGLVQRAVEQGAQLIVFPEYVWLGILGLLPVVRDLAQRGVTLDGAVEELAPGGGLTLEGVFRTIAPAVGRVLGTTASELSRRFGIFLMPGTAVTVDAGGYLYNTAFLYGPDGACIGTQEKLHATPMEVAWMTPGRQLGVWDLPFGRVAMPVCMDYTYWETSRYATLRGADLLLGFSAEAKANEFFMAMRGVPARVQESCAYGCDAFCITRLFGLNFCGPSYIVAPMGLQATPTAFLVKADSPDKEQVFAAELNLAALRRFRAEHAHDFNLALYQRYLPRVYAEFRARVTQEGKRKIV